MEGRARCRTTCCAACAGAASAPSAAAASSRSRACPSQPHVFYFGGTGGGVWKTTDGGIRLDATSPTACSAPASVGRDRGRPVRPERHLRRHGRGAASAATSRTATASTSRPTRARPGRTSACATRGTSAQCASTRRTRTSSTSPRSGTPSARTGARRLPLDGRRQDLGARSSSSTRRRARSTSPWTRPTRASSTPPSGRCVRTPWSLESGGPGSGLFKSTDGGDTWTELGERGPAARDRGARSASPSRRANPSRVWAIIEAEDGGVFRSRRRRRTWSAGRTTSATCASAPGTTRTSSPTRRTPTVYVLNVGFCRSKDGGKTFKPIRTPHGDNHDLWIDPDDPQRMIEGNDGGATCRFNGGATWSWQDNQPTAQFYHVTTDDAFPYRVYGAQQDNTTMAIASRSDGGGIDRTRLVRGRRRRERLHRAQPGRSRHRLRRQLRRRTSRATTTARARRATSPSGRRTRWAGAPRA